MSSLCDDQSSLQARFALASYDTSSSSIIFEKGLMLFEYIQLLSPILIMTLTLSFKSDSALFQPVLFLSRLINPAFWMSFDKTGFLEIVMIVLVCSFTICKVLLCFYIIYRCKRGYEASGVLVSVWKAFMKFQSRITYFYVLSFYVSAMRVINWETYESTDNQSLGIRILALILILFELLLALLPKIRYHSLFPTSSFLSARDNTLEMITIVQKLVVQILFGTLNVGKSASFWGFGIFNLCVDILRIGYFFHRLPLYSFKALYFQGWLLMILTSLDLSFFISVVIKEIDESYNNLSLSMIFWGIFVILGIKSSNNALQWKFWRLVCDPSLDCPYMLVHRIVAIKEFRANTKAHFERNEKYDFSLLANKTLNSHVGEILMITPEDSVNMDINSRESSDKLFQKYLEKLSEKYSRNQYVKIFLAEFYFKQMNMYGDPIRMSLALKKNGNFKIRINAELLLIRIQNDLQKKLRDLHSEQKTPDMLAYISQHTFVAKLKQEMLKQTGLQIKICSEIMNDTPNLEIIYANSQKAHESRKNTIKRINHIATALSEFNIEPLLLTAKYYRSVNHSIQDYLHFNKLYSQRLAKYQKFFAQEKLCQENIFQENAGFLFISGAKGHEGEIIYATKSIQNYLGGDSSKYPGVSFVQKTPPILRPIYSLAWKQISEDPQKTFLNRAVRAFAYHADGYLVEAEYFLVMHPFPTQGFNLVFPLRQIISNREYLLLHENGDIDSASKGVLEKLGLSSGTIRMMNIQKLNEELAIVNEAFNMMAFPQKYQGEGEQENSPATTKHRISLSNFEAEEIYNRFTTTGSNVLLKCFENPGLFYSYNCKIKSEIYGSLIIKTVILEENKRENRERTNEFLSPVNAGGGSNKTWSPTGRFGGGGFSNSSNHSSFRTEQEKEEGWIDFDMMATRRSPFDIPTTDRENLTAAGDITPREDQDLTQRQLIIPTSSTRENKNKRTFYGTTLKKMVTMRKSTGLGHLTDSTNEWMDNYEDMGNNKKVQMSKSSKNLSKFTQQKKISTAFQLSLDTKYHTRTFWGLFGLFFITMGVLAILRVAVKVKLDGDIDDLVAKKEIFSTNGYRNYVLIDNAGLVRFVWQFYSGALNLLDYGPTFRISFYLTRFAMYYNIRYLQAANTNVMQTSSILSEETQLALYEKNVKMYPNYFDDSDQSYTMMGSFQATDRIIETSLDLYQTFLNITLMNAEAKTKIEFLLRNSLNDLMIANNDMSKAMLDSFNKQFDQVKLLKMSFTIFFIVFLCVFLVFFLLFLFKQYVTEVYHISAICKLSHTKIQAIHREFINFQCYLKEDSHNEDGKNAVLFTLQPKKPKGKEEEIMNRTNKENIKIPKTRDIFKRYLGYVVGIMIVLFVLILLIISTSFFNKGPMEDVQNSQERLFFLNHVRIQMSLTSTTFRELSATNNTAMVENEKVLNKLEELTEQLTSLRLNIYNNFLNEDVLEKNPEVRTLLLGDGCSLLNSSLSFYCYILTVRGKPSGFVNLFNEFQDYLQDKVEDYKQSNKTKESLDALQTENYDMITVVYVISLYELNYLWTITNERFEENIAEDNKARKESMITVLVIMGIVSVVGWISILKGLGECVSKFKNILRVFPAELVTGSFILKKFLMKTSKGALENIKNDI